MARKKFLQDLDYAKARPPSHITDIARYDGDGVSFTYWYQHDDQRKEVGLKLITTNIDDYPDGNQYILFTDDADVDTNITESFVQLQAITEGSSISSALQEISGGLHQALTSGQAENRIPAIVNSQHDDSEMDDFSLDEDDDDGDDANFGLDDVLSTRKIARSFSATEITWEQDIDAIKLDLWAAKNAGFKIGVHGSLSKAGIVCVAIRVTKLGISEEAMQAWGLSRNQYLILLIRFQHGYRLLSQVMENTNLGGATEMRVGLSDTYKPRIEEAFAAFNQVELETSSSKESQSFRSANIQTKGSLKPLFIGRPINELLRTRFVKIVKFRDQFNLHWCGAERLFNDRQGAILSDFSKDISSYQQQEDDESSLVLPEVVKSDALSKCKASEASLPLVAMQFVLRHLVRCTQFCLVCHCKVEDTFEALKPYVCQSPLCLYQFLALGFGPAAEWEILSQPYVVDLLVSLCYYQAQGSKMREFPLGINLHVPVLPHFKKTLVTNHYPNPMIAQSLDNSNAAPEPAKVFWATLHSEQKLLSPTSKSWTPGQRCISRGEWLVLVPGTGTHSGLYHCQVSHEQGSSFVLGNIVHGVNSDNTAPIDGRSTSQTMIEGACYLYDAQFDALPDQYRCHAITCLLDTLPSVQDMRSIFTKQQAGHRDVSLTMLRHHCPQPALDLLRWIIASNRSCIMQVDEVANGTDITRKLNPSEDRVSGMDEWMQFRFAQGAPDKEQRFVDCVKSRSKSIEHPTLFAWHGSPVGNWHSIIRQGLHFEYILHGRANGHGVYMSPHISTSMSYTGGLAGRGSTAGPGWPNSVLKVTAVVSLQELVNAPEAFVSRNPHFVVANKDWIQTRYLFVRTGVRHSTGSIAKEIYLQDPLYTARGPKNEAVSIPIAAVSKSRRPGAANLATPKAKKRKLISEEWAGLDDSDADDGLSIATDEEDCKLLSLSEDCSDISDIDDVVMTDIDDALDDLTNQPPRANSYGQTKKRNYESRNGYMLDTSKTDFVPGTLNTTGIRFLNPPSYASITATKALMRAFTDTIKLQEVTPLHDLGFYIDPYRMENMYQWIIELHSFDKSLPLAQDMKEAEITSIVFEMQFTNDFPFSPPFIRVVKPRFLDPLMGGGGHITSGGAICMELLTSTGWSAVSSIESVLLQVRLAMSERERPARLLRGRRGFETAPYNIGEAIAAYKRFCTKHGWQAPAGLDALQSN